jgi:hypothetical protein
MSDVLHITSPTFGLSYRMNDFKKDKILAYSFRERLFCMFNPEYPYSLSIYYNPEISPLIGNVEIAFRFKTQKEINDILKQLN